MTRWLSAYGDVALRTAYLILGDRAAAEDAVQEGFLRAWRSRHTLRDPGAERSWLLAIVANAARSERRRRVPLPIGDALAPAAVRDPFADLDLAAALREALAALSPEQRAVVVLRVYLDRSVAETAAALGVEEGTVKSRLNRALVALRSRWTPTS